MMNTPILLPQDSIFFVPSLLRLPFSLAMGHHILWQATAEYTAWLASLLHCLLDMPGLIASVSLPSATKLDPGERCILSGI